MNFLCHCSQSTAVEFICPLESTRAHICSSVAGRHDGTWTDTVTASSLRLSREDCNILVTMEASPTQPGIRGTVKGLSMMLEKRHGLVLQQIQTCRPELSLSTSKFTVGVQGGALRRS